MSPIKLPFMCLYETGECSKDMLGKIEHELTPEIYENWDKSDWKHFREEDLIEYLLPSLGELRHYWHMDQLIIPIKGRNYKFEIYDNDLHEIYEASGKGIILTPTDEPETPPNGHYRSYYQFFGQPRWVQNRHYPIDLLGNPCYHLVTVENEWGDMGNWNILIGFDENDIPNVAFFEASCC